MYTPALFVCTKFMDYRHIQGCCKR